MHLDHGSSSCDLDTSPSLTEDRIRSGLATRLRSGAGALIAVVGAGTTDERVVARTAVQDVVAFAAGEHLGYLFTGLWTVLIGIAIAGTDLLPAWMGWVGIVVGAGLSVGSTEFLGRRQEDGWALAGAAIPILYIAWSLWLLAMGISLIT